MNEQFVGICVGGPLHAQIQVMPQPHLMSRVLTPPCPIAEPMLYRRRTWRERLRRRPWKAYESAPMRVAYSYVYQFCPWRSGTGWDTRILGIWRGEGVSEERVRDLLDKLNEPTLRAIERR